MSSTSSLPIKGLLGCKVTTVNATWDENGNSVGFR
jgi:hypothetical protein